MNDKCNKEYSFTVYSDGVGGYEGYHTWIKISDGTSAGTHVFSYGPLDANSIDLVLGSVYPGDFNPHEAAARESLSSSYFGFVSQERYIKMLDEGYHLIAYPPDYQLYQNGGDNCVEVTSKILEAAGIKILKGILTPGGVIDEIDVLNTRQNSAYQFYPEYQDDEEECDDEIDESVNNDFNTAANVPPPRIDPLIFDLDGNGIETVAADGSVLFDHTGDGVKYASGWAGADDALLVRDLDQNGQIDNGLELFGDNTIKANGEKATDGFDALSDLDDNNDGVFDHNDTAFDALKLWQDSNQDGVVQEGELKSLDDVGVLSVDLNAINDGSGATGGVIAKKSTYNTVNGESFVVAALDFNANLFYREYHDDFNHQFADEIEAIDLAFNIRGSGAVRNLNQAAVLNSEIVDVIQNITQTNSYKERIGLYQALVSAWAQSAEGFTSAITTLEELVFESGAQISFEIRDETRQRLEKIAVFEAFNFSHMLDYAITENGESSEIRISIGNWSNVMRFNSNENLVLNDAMFTGFAQQAPLINSAYDKLLLFIENTVFKAHDYQQLIDMIEFYIDDQGQLAMSFEAVDQYFIDNAPINPIDTVGLLLSLSTVDNNQLSALGWDSNKTLANMLRALDNEQLAELSQMQSHHFKNGIISSIHMLQDSIEHSIQGNEIIIGGNGNDYLVSDMPTYDDRRQYYAREYTTADALYGEAGDDVLHGGGSNNILDGGEGNDVIVARAGDNKIFGGDGNDIIVSGAMLSEVYYGITDGGVGGEKFLANSHTITEAGKGDDIVNGGISNDVIYAGAGNDEIHSGAGDDMLYAQSGNNMLDGGEGNDMLYAGHDGREQLFGGQGDDILRAKNGDDLLHGQEGDDTLIAHGDNNTLIGGDGSDQYQVNFKNANSTVINNYDSDGSSDFMKLNGVKTTDLRFYREVSNLMIKNLADKNKPKEIVVQNWFDSEVHQIDEIEVGKFTLSNKQIDVIIQTLASFNVEMGVGEDLLNKDQQDEIKSTLANAWIPKSA